MADPVLSGLAGLTRGIFAGLEARQKADRADRELALRERQAGSREQYLQQRASEVDELSDLKAAKIRADIGLTGARAEEIGLKETERATEDIARMSERMTELDQRIAQEEKSLARKSDPSKQAALQSKIGSFKAERDALAEGIKTAEGRVSARSGAKRGGVEPKFRSSFNAIQSSSSLDGLRALGAKLDESAYPPEVWNQLRRTYRERMLELRTGGGSLGMQEEMPLEETE